VATHIWTTLTRLGANGVTGDRDFDQDIDKRSVVKAREFIKGPKSARTLMGTTVNITRPYYQEQVDGIVGSWNETAEGIQEANPMSPIQVANMRVRAKYYTASLVLSKNRVEDEKFGIIQNLVPKILERGLEKMEIDFQNLFINTASTYNALRDQRDGVALASTSHTAGPYGGTWGNLAATPSAMSESTIAQGITSFMSIIDDNGDVAPMAATEFLLFCHPSRLLYAQGLAKSLSSTADYKNSGVINTISPANGIKITVVPMYFQASVTAWGLLALGTDGDTGLKVVVRKSPETPRKIVRENPDQLQYFSDMRYTMFASDPRNTYFNAGT